MLLSPTPRSSSSSLGVSYGGGPSRSLTKKSTSSSSNLKKSSKSLSKSSSGGGQSTSASSTKHSVDVPNESAGNSSLSISMGDCLDSDCPFEALRSLSASSEALAASIAMELAASLEGGSEASFSEMASKKGGDVKNASSSKQAKPTRTYPVALPSSLTLWGTSSLSSRTLLTSSSSSSSSSSAFESAVVASRSVRDCLSSLASAGRRTGDTVRSVEREREAVDREADDVATALRLRSLAAAAAAARSHAEQARHVAARRAMEPVSARALELAGPSTVRSQQHTETTLRRVLLEKYGRAVEEAASSSASTSSQALASLGELTPLLGILGLAEVGVDMYLRYSRSALLSAMVMTSTTSSSATSNSLSSSNTNNNNSSNNNNNNNNKSRPSQQKQEAPPTVCSRLAKVYNSGVIHLRHHLPMVCSALGDASGDVALVQLVHGLVQTEALRILTEFCDQQSLERMADLARRVASRIEDRHVIGVGLETADDGLMGGGGAGGTNDDEEDDDNWVGNVSSSTTIVQASDSGFAASMGGTTLADLDATVDETAMALQHTESYERFIRHAVNEVDRARKMRREKKEAEKAEAAKTQRDSHDTTTTTTTTTTATTTDKEGGDGSASAAVTTVEILPTVTSLNEYVSEIGGHYSLLERVLLLGSLQKSFGEDPRYVPMMVLTTTATTTDTTGVVGATHTSNPSSLTSSSSSSSSSPSSKPLQTTVVEACLYAARRSTVRAIATGHSGTACAVANFCSDALGRVLLETLVRRSGESRKKLAELVALLAAGHKSNSAVLAQQLAFRSQHAMMGAASMAMRNLRVAGASSTEKSLDPSSSSSSFDLAKACAAYNDLDVATDYVRRLETELDREVRRTFATDALEAPTMCVAALTTVHRSFRAASDRAIDDGLVNTVLAPKVRTVVDAATALTERARLRAANKDAAGTVAAGDASTAADDIVKATATVAATASSLLTGSNHNDTTSAMTNDHHDDDHEDYHHTKTDTDGGHTLRSHHRPGVVCMNYELDDETYELNQISEGYMAKLCSSLDELLEPLRMHLAPRLSDAVVLGVLGCASKRIESAIRQSHFTALGAISLDADIRYFVNFAKGRLTSSEFDSTTVLYQNCLPLARLGQIALLMNVDDLEDVLDLIASSRRKTTDHHHHHHHHQGANNTQNNSSKARWDLKVDDTKALLNLRVDFEGRKVNELLRVSENDEHNSTPHDDNNIGASNAD